MRDFAHQLSDCWFVIERSEMLGSKPLGRHVLGEPVVLVRTADGAILALQDRCPHLGVPLSYGRLGPKGLVCRSHGWSFDRRGHCTSIPGAPQEHLDDIRVQSYRTQELDGQIWISRSTTAVLPDCIVKSHAASPSIFLWEKKCAQSAAQMRSRVKIQGLDEGSVVQIDLDGPLGCTARIALCITPETSGTSRIFASARFGSSWLHPWLAQRMTMPTIRRHAHPQSLLGSDLTT